MKKITNTTEITMEIEINDIKVILKFLLHRNEFHSEAEIMIIEMAAKRLGIDKK
jgi:hypothetical protein